MEIYQMKQIAATVELGSFSAAAEQLYISRPAISKTISVVEKELGVTLFTRSKWGAELTEGGRQIYSKIKEVLAAYRELEEEAEKLNGARQKVVMGLSYGLNIVFMDKVMQFNEKHPDIYLEVINVPHDVFSGMIREGKIDIGCSGINVSNAENINVMPVYRCEIYWGVKADSEIAKRGFILEEEIRQIPHCLPKGGDAIKCDRERIVIVGEDNVAVVDDYPYQNIFDDNMFYLLKLVEKGKGIFSIAKDAIPESIKSVVFVPALKNKRYWEVQVYLAEEKPRTAVRTVVEGMFAIE
ncbi:MAG: LysR family transcriptional regulator [Lachnospiraceae bacterium]|nr:LysR family transcriptional regulator [Lachnospiraceae bacterium]